MSDIVVFVIATGLIVGGLMFRKNEPGWIVLAVPASALILGLPVALIFSIYLQYIGDPWLGLHGSWRAIPFGTILGFIAANGLNYVTRTPHRRRDAPELVLPIILFSAVGAVLGTAWGLAAMLLP
jgi:hypothetical protein